LRRTERKRPRQHGGAAAKPRPKTSARPRPSQTKKERGPPLGGSWRRTLSIAHRGHMARYRPGAHRPVGETLAVATLQANRPFGLSFGIGDSSTRTPRRPSLRLLSSPEPGECRKQGGSLQRGAAVRGCSRVPRGHRGPGARSVARALAPDPERARAGSRLPVHRHPRGDHGRPYSRAARRSAVTSGPRSRRA